MPDTVNVTDNGGFDDGLWFGRIATDGTWTPNNRVDSQTGMTARLADAECTLKKLAADPEGVASAYGRGTGSCCFCSRPLDDARSTAVGYGPVCAENFSLSWGNKIRARVPTTEVEKVSEPVGQRRVRVRRAA